MRRSGCLRGLLAGGLLLCWSAAAVCAEATEPGPQLQSLRRAGRFDEALHYLERMRTSPLASEEFKETIDYEAGMTLIEGARATRSVAERERRLAEAKEKLAKFLADHPRHFLASGAETQVARLLVELGRIKAEQAAQLGNATAERRKLQDAARGLFREAETVLAASETRLAETFKGFGFVDPRDMNRTEQRDQVRREQTQAQLARAWVLFELAQTHDQGTPERHASLTDAAKRFGELGTKHGERLVGLYARLGQGRCYTEMGETQKALEIFEGLQAWPDEPEAFHVMKGEALLRILELAPSHEPRKSQDALRFYRKWVDAARPSEQPSEQDQAVRYHAAEVALAYARTLKDDDPDKANLRKASLRIAREGFKLVAEGAGPHQQKARVRLLDPLVGGEGGPAREPADFAEARDRAKAAMERMAAAEAEARIAPADRSIGDRITQARDEAVKYSRLALTLRTPDVSDEEEAVVHYHIAYLDLKSGRTQEAAKEGENLARRGGESATAREGAKIALAAYDRMVSETPPGKNRDARRASLLAMANSMITRWASYPEAEEAQIVLLRTAVEEGRLEQAEEHLQQIPVSSARRGDAELCLGQARWAAYLRAARAPEGVRPTQSQLAKKADEAQQLLEAGIERTRKSVDAGSPVSPHLAAAVLALAHIDMAAGKAGRVVQLLEDPKIGAMTLVDAQDPVALRGNYSIETCRVALRAYVAVQQSAKAQRAMQQIERLVRTRGETEAARQLTHIYISTGRDLQRHVERLRSQDKAEELGGLLGAYEAFLKQLADRKEGNTFHSLQWVAEAFFGLGAGFDLGGLKLTLEAEKYYRKAADAYRVLLARCEAEKQFAPQPEAIIAVQIRWARCLRRLGEFQEAFDLLQQVLKKQANLVDAQVEAAYVYQSWGDDKPDYLDSAIGGDAEHPEIWGWGPLARRIQANPEYKDIFYEARFNLALCRFRQGQSQSEPDQREKLLRTAESDVLSVHKAHPDMGGKLWYDKYNELLKRIQRLRNQDPVGLPGLAGESPGGKD